MSADAPQDHKEAAELVNAQTAAKVAPSGMTAAGKVAAGDPHPKDVPAAEPGKTKDTALDPARATGAQRDPAIVTPTGSLPHQHVGSPTGPVPVSAVTTTTEEADQRLEDYYGSLADTSSDQELTEDKVNATNRATLLAIANDRGYDMGGVTGRRAVRQRFLEQQSADKSLRRKK